MNTPERKAWVKTLKPGDEVCYQTPGINGGHFVVTLVKNRTPQGGVRTLDGVLFNSEGRTSYYSSHYVHLEPYSEDRKAQVLRKQLANRARSSLWVLANNVNLSKLPDALLQEFINLEDKIKESMREPVKDPEPLEKLCSCGREATRVYTDPQFGGKSDVCDDCYDIEECQDQGSAVTGESYSAEECLEILKGRGWKSHYN